VALLVLGTRRPSNPSGSVAVTTAPAAA
jgi:hypothetical protein